MRVQCAVCSSILQCMLLQITAAICVLHSCTEIAWWISFFAAFALFSLHQALRVGFVVSRILLLWLPFCFWAQRSCQMKFCSGGAGWTQVCLKQTRPDWMWSTVWTPWKIHTLWATVLVRVRSWSTREERRQRLQQILLRNADQTRRSSGPRITPGRRDKYLQGSDRSIVLVAQYRGRGGVIQTGRKWNLSFSEQAATSHNKRGTSPLQPPKGIYFFQFSDSWFSSAVDHSGFEDRKCARSSSLPVQFCILFQQICMIKWSWQRTGGHGPSEWTYSFCGNFIAVPQMKEEEGSWLKQRAFSAWWPNTKTVVSMYRCPQTVDSGDISVNSEITFSLNRENPKTKQM